MAESGRRAEAPRWYETVRARLAQEFGVDPSPVLREAHQRLLAMRPEVGTIPRSEAARVARWPPTCRTSPDGWEGGDAGGPARYPAVGRPSVASITGIAGVGKTALAVYLAAQDAYGLLRQPERWILEHADGHVQPYRTVEGETAPREQWFEYVIETARSLPLKP